ncbi:QueE [Alteromonas phage vB_AcoS-R7M]|uniref:QueE n=1 Tax=Alteromonas phage vB_AcoS-R7M TaxID=2729541 RepID=A0A6M3YNN8_9CAUD|nr:QueE-like radical SAM domain [Alteromonas phage vB_AcoS-R7M]QJI53371.1 QueE [Alteromonas phage vB_AcoS-R7M]
MLNQQPAEKQILTDRSKLEVHSIFPTIQGEGPFSGCPAIFVRLAGCNLQCPGCDTDYTSSRETMHTNQVVKGIMYCHTRAMPGVKNALVVITGGEPFRQNITLLCQALVEEGYDVQIETNGSLRPPPGFPDGVTVVCSPKTARINKETADRADCFKYVLKRNCIHYDGLPTQALDNGSDETIVARPPEDFEGDIYLQPMDEKDVELNKANIEAVVKSCIQFGYILQLQTHKYIGVE